MKSVKYNRRRYQKRFYILITICSLLLVATIYSIISLYQGQELGYAVEDIQELSFKPSVELTKWHNNEVKYVYLTFDDGPTKNAPKILDILKQYDIPATFFVLGSSIKGSNQSQEILNRMIQEGHYIGLHSMTHDRRILYGTNGPINFVSEMKELKLLVSNLTDGFQSEICRAPYGTGGGTFTSSHVAAIQQANIKCWDWDVDSLDWKYSKDPSTVYEIIKNQTQMNLSKKDLIVLFHEKDSTVSVLPKVIEYYQNLGYEFMPFSSNNSVNRMFFKTK